MSFFRKMFGSKNRKNFKPGVETKQTVDGQQTEEKYSTYDEKKQHEAELWAKLLLKGRPQYNESNANSLGLEYNDDSKDSEHYLKYEHYTAVSGLRMLIHDRNCCVCRLSETVNLTTLRQKESNHSGTVRFLKKLEKMCLSHPDMTAKWISGTVFMLSTRPEEEWKRSLDPTLRSAFAACDNDSLLQYLGSELKKKQYDLKGWGNDLIYCLNELTNKKLEQHTYRLLDQ